MSESDCVHLNFLADVSVSRLKNEEEAPDDQPVSNYLAEVKIKCSECGKPFRFIGLPCGVDLTGAAVSIDGQEARLRILPYDQVLTPLEGLTGFTVKRSV